MLKLDCDTEVHFTFRGATERKQVMETLNELQMSSKSEKACQGKMTHIKQMCISSAWYLAKITFFFSPWKLDIDLSCTT